MRLGCDEITDSVLVRVEHHWAAPDQEPLEFYVDEVSGTHFWTVDGTGEDGIEGTEDLLLDARFTYVGNEATALDYDLYNDTEENGFLAWRRNSDDAWEQYPDYTWQAGSMVNGGGLFKVDNLRKGQYTFANGDISLNIDEALTESLEGQINIYPSPASFINLDWSSAVNPQDEKAEASAVALYDSSLDA